MADPLEIEIKLNREQAKSELADHAASEQRSVDSTRQAAEKKKEIYRKSMTDEEVMIAAKNSRIDAANNARIANAVKGMQTEQEKYKQIYSAEEVMVAAKNARIDASNNAMVANAVKSLMTEQEKYKQVYTYEEALAAAKNKRIDQLNSAKVDSAMKWAKLEAFQQESLAGKIGIVGSALGKNIAAYATLGTVSQVVGVITKMWKDQRADVEGSVLRLIDYKDKLLELAALKGNLGNATPLAAEQIDFRNKTLQTRDAALTFQKGLMNSGEAAKGAGFINDANLQDLGVYVGQLQGATNIDPNALGNISGSLPMMIGQKNQDAKEVFRRLSGIMDTFKVGKQDAGPAISQFEKNMSLIGPGQFETPEQAASIQSAFSLAFGDEAGTGVRQFVKATTGGLVANQNTGVEGSIKQAEYLKQLGVTGQNNPIEIGKAMVADLQKQQALLKGQKNADGSAKIVNPVEYLATKGISDQESVRGLQMFAKLMEGGKDSTWEKFFESRTKASSAPAFDEAMEPINAFKNTDVAGGRRAATATDAADVAIGTGPEAYYLNLKRIAFQNLRVNKDDRFNVYGSFDDYNKDHLYEGVLHDEMKRMMLAEAKRVNVTVPENYIKDNKPIQSYIQGVISTGTMGQSDKLLGMLGTGTEEGVLGGGFLARAFNTNRSRADAYYGLATAIAKEKGDIYPAKELMAEMKKTTEATKAVEKAIRDTMTPDKGKATPQIQPATRPGARQAITR